MAGKEDKKVLIGRKNICEFLSVGKNALYKLMDEGLPVTKQGGQLVAHKDRLNEFFYKKAPQ